MYHWFIRLYVRYKSHLFSFFALEGKPVTLREREETKLPVTSSQSSSGQWLIFCFMTVRSLCVACLTFSPWGPGGPGSPYTTQFSSQSNKWIISKLMSNDKSFWIQFFFFLQSRCWLYIVSTDYTILFITDLWLCCTLSLSFRCYDIYHCIFSLINSPSL